MEERFIVISDIHCHNYKEFDNNGSRLLNTLKVIEDTFILAAKENIKIILFAGDLYDQQKSLPTEVVNAVIDTFYKMFTKYPEIKWVAISGNHDHASKNIYDEDKKAVSALAHLSVVFENFILIDNIAYLVHPDVLVYGIPYYEFPEHFDTALTAAALKAEDYKKGEANLKNILLVHQTPLGLPNTMIPVDTDPTDKRYSNFDMVFCGHIHARQRITENFSLVGSPLHRDQGDVGKEKGVLIATMKDPANYAFIPYDYPKFKVYRQGESIDEHNVYPVVIPEQQALTPKDVEIVENFGGALSSVELTTNYWQEVSSDEKLLKTGLSFLAN